MSSDLNPEAASLVWAVCTLETFKRWSDPSAALKLQYPACILIYISYHVSVGQSKNMRLSFTTKHNTTEHKTKPKPTLFIPLPMMTLSQSAMSCNTLISDNCCDYVDMDFEHETRSCTDMRQRTTFALWVSMFVFCSKTLLSSSTTTTPHSSNVITLTSSRIQQQQFRHAASSSGLFWRDVRDVTVRRRHLSDPWQASDVHIMRKP